ncbi:MAG: helix-turn-helix domain-containing protein [Aquabacterium sp.]|uniref:helix-turn-helix domain-containing protein n=1 Tax=Aquabacterium sp. TaxID=1872578 RepID=UPI00122B9716|nr:helix-turn-helix domain-containing protein [Aquabacterium sp.]TAK87302.1 MAG: helix-turn-helix domain-containing protein [Aquabacterium sp.]
MDKDEIASLRKSLKLTQQEFGQLFDAHAMTVSKWERGVFPPSAYQQALLQRFKQTADEKEDKAKQELKNLLVGAGVVAALIWLLNAGK